MEKHCKAASWVWHSHLENVWRSGIAWKGEIKKEQMKEDRNTSLKEKLSFWTYLTQLCFLCSYSDICGFPTKFMWQIWIREKHILQESVFKCEAQGTTDQILTWN